MSPASPIGWQIGMPLPFGWQATDVPYVIKATIGGVVKYYHANSAAHDAYHNANHTAYSALYGGHGAHGSSHYDTHSRPGNASPVGVSLLAEVSSSVASPVGWQVGQAMPAGWSTGPWFGTITNGSGQIYNAHSNQHRQYHQQNHQYYNQLYGGHHHRQNNGWNNWYN